MDEVGGVFLHGAVGVGVVGQEQFTDNGSSFVMRSGFDRSCFVKLPYEALGEHA